MLTITTEQHIKAKECIQRLVQLKTDFMAAGMYKTGHALEKGVKTCGWELAELLENAAKARN